ncbi:MAG: HNH endonuclease [Clostridia bacterium]|nr:HNH endonuclease [Clostridia bacterium]
MAEFRKLKSLKFLYEINEFGVLRNVKSKKIVYGYTENNGYQRVRIENKCLGGVVRTSIHRLVAEAFIPNPDGLPEVNHIDTNKQNNHVSNLEWIDHSGNMKHAYAHGINCEPLREHSAATRKKVSNGTTSFDSISDAAKWLASIGKSCDWRSAVAGISAVIHGKRHTFGGYEWKCV